MLLKFQKCIQINGDGLKISYTITVSRAVFRKRVQNSSFGNPGGKLRLCAYGNVSSKMSGGGGGAIPLNVLL